MERPFIRGVVSRLLAAAFAVWSTVAASAQPASQPAFRYPVIVIPGIMGSRLEKNGQVLWGDSIWTMKERFQQLALPPDLSDDGVTPAGPIPTLRVIGGVVKLKEYTELLSHLRAAGLQDGRSLFVFSYDWRRSSADAARKLADQVAIWAKAAGNPNIKFQIVAHSMGGLVAKYYINRLGGHD